MIMESMGGRDVKFLLLGYVSIVIQNTGNCSNVSLCRYTHPKMGIFFKRVMMFGTYYSPSTGMNFSLEKHLSFSGKHIYYLFLEEFEFFRPTEQGSQPLLRIKFWGFFQLFSSFGILTIGSGILLH